MPQFALIRDAVKALNLQVAELPGYEADDIIATYARRAAALGAEVTIVSSDKDLMQLVDERISLFDPVKQRRIGGPEVVERFGVPPEKVVDVQALAGDSSDNVPGVPGIGVKTAAQLIEEYGDLDTLLARADEIRQPKRRSNLIEFAEQARVSRELVLLRDDAPVAEDLDAFAVPGLDPARLRPFLEEQGFASIIARLGSAGEEERPAAPVEAEYELVTDEETLKRWVEAGFEAGIVAIDTETDSLDAQRARLVGLSLAVGARQGLLHPRRARPDGGTSGSGSAAPAFSRIRACNPKAAALLRRRAEGRAEHQIRHGSPRRARHPRVTHRRHDGAVLCARRIEPRPRHGRTRASASRP